MRRVIPLLILLVFLIGVPTAGGCADFDWEKAAKQIAIGWLKDKVIVAVNKYKGDEHLKTLAINWVMEGIDKAVEDDWRLKKGLGYFDIEGAISDCWDYYVEDSRLYMKAAELGLDVNARHPEPYEHYVCGGDFPELTELLMDKL